MYNYKLENVIEDTDHVFAISDKGQQIRGKYLVGAEGVGSKIRSLLNKNKPENQISSKLKLFLK